MTLQAYNEMSALDQILYNGEIEEDDEEES
jgi:hypothetical protein